MAYQKSSQERSGHFGSLAGFKGHQGKLPLLVWGKFGVSPGNMRKKSSENRKLPAITTDYRFTYFTSPLRFFYLQLPGIIRNYIWFTMNYIWFTMNYQRLTMNYIWFTTNNQQLTMNYQRLTMNYQ